MLEAHAPVLQRSFAFHPHERFSKLSRDVPPIGRGPTFVSGNVKTCIRAITARHSLLPISYSLSTIGRPCGLLSSEGERYGVSTFHAKKSYRLRCLLSTGMHLGHETHSCQVCLPHPVPFGSSAIDQATYACYSSRSLSPIHICSPYRLASTYPACGCQEGLSLTLDTPHLSVLRSSFVPLSLPLFIQA